MTSSPSAAGDAGPTLLGPRQLAEVMAFFEAGLEAHRDTVNRLNVFPVPDGDTGTNMQLTVESVMKELAELQDQDDLAAVTAAIAHGSLMGARGNSGVILCQVLRGVADTARESPEGLSAEGLAAALGRAAELARAGVMRPVEGTILSVADAAAVGALERAQAGEGLPAVAASARVAAVAALARTPQQLPVLERAGVVDAGGAGLVLLYDALVAATSASPLPEELPLPESVRERLATGTPLAEEEALDEERPEGGSELRYEVMYLLEAADELVPAFKEVWQGIGDSIVVVGGNGLWNCHIHTDDIGPAIEAALDVGRPRAVRVTDLREQVEEESWVRTASEQPQESKEGPAPRTSVVAVATGEGIRRIFHSLGARHIVAGGQSMNPSTADVLAMIEAAPGEEVVLLPNNKNIFAVAAQAAAVSAKPASVVPTAGIQEGFAALLEYDPEASAADNASGMSSAAERVVAGEVTRAVRASDTPAGPVRAGDWIGLTREGVATVGSSASEAACGLLESIVEERHEIVTIIEGASASPAETRRITEWLAANRPGVSIELHHGGQPLYPYLLAAE